ncbi:MAG: hypothetical protein AAFN94_11685 [Pseudomonadota bacterium]
MLMAALILAAGGAQADWYCASGLVPGMVQPFSKLEMDVSLDPDGGFTAQGTVRPQGEAHDFGWTGTWTELDGQIVMIGKTRGRTFGVAPAGELRAMATQTRSDVLMLELSSDEHPGTGLRCLTHPLE